jgi:hypothetical protein
MVVVGIFLPWFDGIPSGEIAASTGWGMVGTTAAPILVLISGILMAVGGLVAFLFSLVSAGVEGVLIVIGFAVRAIAIVAVIGTIWYIADIISEFGGGGLGSGFGLIGYGAFIAFVFAGLGLAFGGTSHGALSGGGESVDLMGEDSGVARAATFSRRQYMEEGTGAPKGAVAGASKQHFNRAVELEAMGEYDKAIAEYSQAIASDSKYTMAYFNRGLIFMTQGKKFDAIKDFQKVIVLGDNPDLARMAGNRIEELEK